METMCQTEATPSMRLANMDALRVLAMCMIVMQHQLYHGGILAAIEQTPGTALYAIWGLYGFCSAAVDIFVLLSGYFLCTQHFRVKRVLLLIVQVLFYSLGIYLILCLTGHAAFKGRELVENLLPLLTRQYWFLTAYLGLALLTPFLNRIFVGIGRRSHTILCLLLLLMAGARPGLALLDDRFSTGGETGAMWFVCLYMVGAWLRLWYRPRHAHQMLHLGGVAACAGMIALIRFLLWKNGSGRNPYDFVRYHTAIVFIEALLIFMVFLNLPQQFVGARVFSVLGPAAFGVYLLHDNRYLRGILWGIVQPVRWVSTAALLPCLFLCPVAIFVICAGAELLRARLFAPISRSEKLTAFCAGLEHWVNAQGKL